MTRCRCSRPSVVTTLSAGRFYKFVVKRLLGPFIKYDLDLDQAKLSQPTNPTPDHPGPELQLDVKLGEGMVQLHDLELNAEVSGLAWPAIG